MTTKPKPDHQGRCPCVLLNLLLLSLRHIPYAAAQAARKAAPPPDPFQFNARFRPAMGIVLVAAVASLFLVGFFAVYLRHCFGGRVHTGVTVNSSDWGRSRPRGGLDPDVVATFPTLEYSAVKRLKIVKGALECAVCLSEFGDDETLRLIPKCDHAFHPDCIDAWLASHTTCPVCRACLVPDPDELAAVLIPIPDSEAPRSEPIIVLESDSQGGGPGEATHGEVAADTRTSGAIASEKRPGGSISMRARIAGMFSRSHSTGHSLDSDGVDWERFTLRLPEGVREQIIYSTLNRTMSCMAFPRAKSLGREPRSELSVAGPKWMFPILAFLSGARSAKVAADGHPGRTGHACDPADKENGRAAPAGEVLEWGGELTA